MMTKPNERVPPWRGSTGGRGQKIIPSKRTRLQTPFRRTSHCRHPSSPSCFFGCPRGPMATHVFRPSDGNPTFITRHASSHRHCAVHAGTRQPGPQPACLTSPHAPVRALAVPLVLSRTISFHVFRVPPEWDDRDRRSLVWDDLSRFPGKMRPGLVVFPPRKLVAVLLGFQWSSRGWGGCSEGFRSSIASEELGCAILVDVAVYESPRCRDMRPHVPLSSQEL